MRKFRKGVFVNLPLFNVLGISSGPDPWLLMAKLLTDGAGEVMEIYFPIGEMES